MMRRDTDCYAGSARLRPDAAEAVQPRRRRSAGSGRPLSGTKPIGLRFMRVRAAQRLPLDSLLDNTSTEPATHPWISR
jgi:hypothetical protein